MKRLHNIVLAGAMLSLAAGPITVALVRAQDETPHARKRPFAHGEKMDGRFASAPLISIALRHQSELNLNSEQVANLEKI